MIATTTISLIILIAIIISIVVGYKAKINVGLVAIPFAYIIGCFLLKLQPSKVITMWPISIFFVILAIGLFFGFAVANGTLETLSNNLLYRCRSVPLLLPLAFFFVAVLIAALGAGYFTVMVLMLPPVLIICKKINVHPLVGALCVDCGGQVGSNFMVAMNGVIYRNLITSEGFSGDEAFLISVHIFVVYLVMTFLVIGGMLLYYRKKGKGANGTVEIELEPPKPFNKTQKKNLYLIAIFVILLLVPPILHLIVPKSTSIAFLNSNVDVGLISIIFTVIAFLMHLGDDKSVLAKVPWNTLLMISGIGMLVAVAVKAGTIELLAKWVGSNIPTALVPISLCVIAIIVGIFGGSFVGVLAPALFPVIASISHATGLNPVILYTALTVGGLSTGISPFGAGGAMALGLTPEKEWKAMFSKELFVGLPICGAAAIIVTLIYTLVIH